MEIYQWLLRRQKLSVSNTGYFVYCNARKDKHIFDSHLFFDIQIIAYTGSDNWIEPVITCAHQCLMKEDLPDYSPTCGYCGYRKTAHQLENNLPLSNFVKEIQPELF